MTLAGGGRVIISNPTPVVTVAPPSGSRVAVVPVRGPRGPKGEPGDGDGGGVSPTVLEEAIEQHEAAPEPHPAYDDMPSLTLIFENHLI